MARLCPVEAILGSRDFTQSNVQALVGMRDMSEMILLSLSASAVGPSERGGNISDYSFTYYRDGDKVKSVKTSKATDIPAGAKAAIRKLTIKDTDAGLLNTNVF